MHVRQAASGCESVAVCVLCKGRVCVWGLGSVHLRAIGCDSPSPGQMGQARRRFLRPSMTLEAGRMGAREGQRLLEGEEAASSRAAGASVLDAVHRQTVLKTIPPAGSRSQGTPRDESLALPGGEGDGRWGASHRH